MKSLKIIPVLAAIGLMFGGIARANNATVSVADLTLVGEQVVAANADASSHHGHGGHGHGGHHGGHGGHHGGHGGHGGHHGHFHFFGQLGANTNVALPSVAVALN